MVNFRRSPLVVLVLVLALTANTWIVTSSLAAAGPGHHTNQSNIVLPGEGDPDSGQGKEPPPPPVPNLPKRGGSLGRASASWAQQAKLAWWTSGIWLARKLGAARF
jgi:hypothetical protein